MPKGSVNCESLHAEALLLQQKGDHHHAMEVAKKALHATERAFQEADLPGGFLAKLAELCYEAGLFPTAELFWRRAIANLEQTDGLDYPEIGRYLARLGFFCRDQKRYTEAELFLERAAEIFEGNQLIEDAAPILDELIVFYDEIGQPQKAAAANERRNAIRTRV
jgi:tetratricopeptide (TPR) repeat protein